MFKSYLVVKIFGSNYAYYVGESDTPDGALHLAKLHPEYTRHRDYQLSYSRLGDDFHTPIKGLAQFIQGGEIEVWLAPSKESFHFWSALIEWQRANTDFMRLYWYMKYQELSDQMRIMNDNAQVAIEASEPSFEDGYHAGTSDGILMVSREMETSVLNDAHWRKEPFKNDVRSWQLLFIQQLASAQKAQKKTDDALALLAIIADNSPLPDTSRIELIKKLARQAQLIATLERDNWDMMQVDYGAVVQLAIETGLDTAWNNANVIQREHIKDILKGLSDVI